MDLKSFLKFDRELFIEMSNQATSFTLLRLTKVTLLILTLPWSVMPVLRDSVFLPLIHGFNAQVFTFHFVMLVMFFVTGSSTEVWKQK